MKKIKKRKTLYEKALEFSKNHHIIGIENFEMGKRSARLKIFIRLCVIHAIIAGYQTAEKELERREREAFEAGHKAKIKQEYNSSLIKNGFVRAAGRYISVEEAFEDYKKSRGEG